jgi:hypothetical protein
LLTRPVHAETARDPASYQVEHYRYEYTAAYGSPELERTRVAIERIDVRSDRRAVDLITSSLVKDRVYAISAGGIRSEADEPLVHATGVYTLNEVPVR